ncbi:MAG: GDSL-type esterase/lipase family protein [Candidatus Lernaella stagnicola]|nr:GDSL-type esterase/lipase family protein [Candidatus Lernaella stagnicola]
MPPKRSKPRWTRRRVLFLLLAYAIVFLAAEATVRIINPMTARPAYYGYPEGLIIPDETIGHRYHPGFRGRFMSPRYRDVEININAAGFRDTEWNPTPSPDVPRAIVLGDSITFGSPLPIDQRFDNVAETTLAQQDSPLDMCNCGVNGFAVAQYDLLLREVGPQLAPEIVVVGLCLNDAEPLSPADDARIQAAKEAEKRGTLQRAKERLKTYRLDFDKSYFVNLIIRGAQEWAWKIPGAAPRMADRYAQKTRRQLEKIYADGTGLPRLRKHLTAMRRFTEEKLGARFLVVVFPYRHMLHETRPWIIDEVTKLLADEGITHLNLAETFRVYRNHPELYAHRDDCHPAALGHRLAGEKLAALAASWLRGKSALVP